MIAKTGTAEFGDKPPLPTHAWMVAGRGDLAVAVFVDEGKSGSGTAGPILRAVPRAGAQVSQEPVQEGYRTFEPVDPASRPVRTRRAARVLLVDDVDRMLLFADSDPGLPDVRWWITTGGGVDAGESDAAAAVREVFEETGLVATVAELIGPIATRHVVHGYTDVVVRQDEVFFGLRASAFEVSDVGHTEEERITMTSHRWWSREELAGTDQTVWPVAVLELWDLMQQWRAGEDPVDLGTQQESTVPA